MTVMAGDSRRSALQRHWLRLSVGDERALRRAQQRGKPISRGETLESVSRLYTSEPNDCGSNEFSIRITLEDWEAIQLLAKDGRVSPRSERLVKRLFPLAKSLVARQRTKSSGGVGTSNRPRLGGGVGLDDFDGEGSTSVRTVGGGGFESSRRRH